MSDLTTMDVKRLRNEVQDLRDELALMKRKFEDILYNLDTDNFSPRVVKQGNDMYTKIEQNAEGITLQAEKIDENVQNLASLKVTADEIETAVFEKTTDEDGNTQKISKIEQTAEAIRSEVKTEVDTVNGKFEKYSTTLETETLISNKISQEMESISFENYYTKTETLSQISASANTIQSTVANTYQTKKDADSNYTTLSGSISTVTQTANGISSKVEKMDSGEFGDKGFSLFTQTASGFKLSGKVEISGDLVSGGTISGVNFSNASENTYLTIGDSKGAWGDLRLVSKWSSGELTTFQIYEAAEGVIMSLYENPVMEVSSAGSGSYTYAYVTPKGTWDFSNEESCSILLPDGIGGGGTATAVFG